MVYAYGSIARTRHGGRRDLCQGDIWAMPLMQGEGQWKCSILSMVRLFVSQLRSSYDSGVSNQVYEQEQEQDCIHSIRDA